MLRRVDKRPRLKQALAHGIVIGRRRRPSLVQSGSRLGITLLPQADIGQGVEDIRLERPLLRESLLRELCGLIQMEDPYNFLIPPSLFSVMLPFTPRITPHCREPRRRIYL